MPISKKRKKKGKKVSNGMKLREARLERAGDKESSITLQDLINVVAYQEAHGLVGKDAENHPKEND